jgi:hypothetical protein
MHSTRFLRGIEVLNAKVSALSAENTTLSGDNKTLSGRVSDLGPLLHDVEYTFNLTLSLIILTH